MVPVAISIPIATATAVSITAFAVLVSLLALHIAKSFSLLLIFLSLATTIVSFRLTFGFGQLELPLLPLALFFLYTALLFFDRLFLLAQLFADSFSLVPSCLRVGFVLDIRLGAARAFAFGNLVAYVAASEAANRALYGVNVDQLCDNIFSFLVHARSFESAVNESGCFATVQRKQLLRVAFDFLFGDFENRFRHLLFIVLQIVSSAVLVSGVRCTHASFKLVPDLLSDRVVVSSLLKA